MKQLLNIFEKDIRSENFSRQECIVFGILAPVAFVAAVAFVNWLFS